MSGLDYTSPPHLHIRVLWRLPLPTGGEVEAIFVPHEDWIAVLIKRNGTVEAAKKFDKRESALAWAESVRVRLLFEE